MKHKKGPLGLMTLKIDMAKAYDRVEWSFLFQILKSHGFCAQFIHLLSQCITTVSFSFLINGSPFGSLTPSRGLRQGDPLSPALFVLYFDLMARLLHRAELDGSIHGIKISRHSPAIANLMFADDLTIFCRATLVETAALLKPLTTFCDWSGQLINFSKSSIHFSNNVPGSLRRSICRQIGMLECDHRGSYLGLPFCKGRSATAAFTPLIDKLKRRLGGWQSKVLSQAGRSVLIKSVAQSLPVHTMQTFSLPVSLCHKLDGLMRDFWWGYKADGPPRLYLAEWKKLCTPKQAGGMGFKRCKDMNVTFMTKLAWEVLQKTKNHGLNLSAPNIYEADISCIISLTERLLLGSEMVYGPLSNS